MSEHPVIARAADLDRVDQVLCRLCESDEEVAAIKRVLGVEAEENRITDAFTPEPPPEPLFRPNVDSLAHARRAIARYSAWVNSHPDGDSTSLEERQRILNLAQLDLQRLEGDTP